MFIFGVIHPEDEGRDRLLDRCFQEYRFPGLKFHCHVTGIRPDDGRMFPTIHAGVGPSLDGYKESTRNVSGVRFVRNVLKKFPRLKLIVPHLGADEFDEFLRSFLATGRQ